MLNESLEHRVRVGENLEKVRKSQGYSVLGVSKATGLSQLTISKSIEKAKSDYQVSKLVPLTEFYKIDIAEPFGDFDIGEAPKKAMVWHHDFMEELIARHGNAYMARRAVGAYQHGTLRKYESGGMPRFAIGFGYARQFGWPTVLHSLEECYNNKKRH